jgi:hypothetical protein
VIEQGTWGGCNCSMVQMNQYCTMSGKRCVAAGGSGLLWSSGRMRWGVTGMFLAVVYERVLMFVKPSSSCHCPEVHRTARARHTVQAALSREPISDICLMTTNRH